jgi:3-oxoacyl-[acyl-carrier protein] reductase
VAVNAILPTAIEEAGVFRDRMRTEVLQFMKSFRPMQRHWTTSPNAVEYAASILAAIVGARLIARE